jgi:hypothetical protein
MSGGSKGAGGIICGQGGFTEVIYHWKARLGSQNSLPRRHMVRRVFGVCVLVRRGRLAGGFVIDLKIYEDI